MNLCEKGLSIIFFHCDQTNNFMTKSQDIKKLQTRRQTSKNWGVLSLFFKQFFKQIQVIFFRIKEQQIH